MLCCGWVSVLAAQSALMNCYMCCWSVPYMHECSLGHRAQANALVPVDKSGCVCQKEIDLFNIKIVFPCLEIPIIKINWLWDCLIFIMRTAILKRWHSYMEIYLGHGEVITFCSILWYIITYLCYRYLPMAHTIDASTLHVWPNAQLAKTPNLLKLGLSAMHAKWSVYYRQGPVGILPPVAVVMVLVLACWHMSAICICYVC